MLFNANYSLRSLCFKRSVRLATASLLLLLTINTTASASNLPAFANISSNAAGTVSVSTFKIAVEESASNAIISNSRKPDWNGVYRDIGIIVGLQFAAVGITYVLPESFSSWSPEQKKAGVKKYGDNFTHPVFDEDKFYINYILHPYWGATYYTRGRERGLDRTSSFLYSALLSAMYEFGTECIAEKPSIQDLIATPVGGALLGAFIFEPLRDSIKRKQELAWYDHAALIATDPLGLLSFGFEKLFGIKSTVMVNYSVPQLQNRSTGSVVASNSSRFDVIWQFPLNP